MRMLCHSVQWGDSDIFGPVENFAPGMSGCTRKGPSVSAFRPHSVSTWESLAGKPCIQGIISKCGTAGRRKSPHDRAEEEAPPELPTPTVVSFPKEAVT